ncbi:hypothetical protein [Agromyces bauzanensis]|uniref:Uncharacterized protein n=1 Tax=Agromyces bauzanensis TaxID=1308924 RepID=A0A917USD2_9MICO|nr:hypothetical protein [Agromyces bauzanensis]GGJ81976.1 hypothetical protein GCM10011372_20500 [Agromyces bauzanensis]
MSASTVVSAGTQRTEARSRAHEIWRTVRLHSVTPYVFFGIPWLILGGVWAVTMVAAVILRGAGVSDATDGFRYSWAVLSPQWYLVVVGVQAIAYTFSFALGFGATRRDFWLGTSLMFVLVSVEMAAAIATLVQIEQATGGWWIGAGMFDTLWYGQQGWLVDFYTTFALQLLVLFVGASVTTVYLRWRMRGMMIMFFSAAALVLILVAGLTFTESWTAVFDWFASIGIVGTFTVVLAKALAWAVVGYFVIRRATPR